MSEVGVKIAIDISCESDTCACKHIVSTKIKSDIIIIIIIIIIFFFFFFFFFWGGVRSSCYSTRLSWAHTPVINWAVCLGQKVSS